MANKSPAKRKPFYEQNDRFLPIDPPNYLGTVDALEATGAKRLQLDDADFERFLYSQSNDAEAVSKAINEASASVVKAIEERAQATQGQTGK